MSDLRNASDAIADTLNALTIGEAINSQSLEEATEDPASSPEEVKTDELLIATNAGTDDANADVEPAPEVRVKRPREFAVEIDLPRIAPTLAIDMEIVVDFLQRCMTSSPRVRYGLGAKVPSHGSEPGSGFKKIDCSGFVREAIRLATDPMVKFPDGSVIQHEWVRTRGFTIGDTADGTKTDGKVRIAFLPPGSTKSGIGHVALLFHGMTVESHGGIGPNTRLWTGSGWQGKCKIYVLR